MISDKLLKLIARYVQFDMAYHVADHTTLYAIRHRTSIFFIHHSCLDKPNDDKITGNIRSLSSLVPNAGGLNNIGGRIFQQSDMRGGLLIGAGQKIYEPIFFQVVKRNSIARKF